LAAAFDKRAVGPERAGKARMADELKKESAAKNNAGQEFCELDSTLIRVVAHEEELVSPTVHAILPIDTEHDIVGTTVGGTIVVRSMIGSGGMSSVYRGTHSTIKRDVAVKVMHKHLLSDDTALSRFKQEAQAVGKLDHPNIVKVHDFNAGEGGNSYLIMDLVEGVSLSDAIEQSGPLDPQRATEIFIQACDGLQHAHSKGIVHRDLKPSNIMLVNTDDGKERVKVLDFGIAKILPQAGDKRMKLTETGEVFGSPLYMSPEQCMGKSVDQRSDVYSMGCLIFEALTGRPPLEGANAFDTFFKHTTEMPPSVTQYRPDCPLSREFDAIVLKAMAKDPKDRYQSMSQLRIDLMGLNENTDRGLLNKLSSDLEFARRQFGAQKKRSLKSIVAITAITLAIVGTATGGIYYFSNIIASQSATWENLFVAGQDKFDRGDYVGATSDFQSALSAAKTEKTKVIPALRELVDLQVAQGSFGEGDYEARATALERERDTTVLEELDELVSQFKLTAKETGPDVGKKLEDLANDINDKNNLLVDPSAKSRDHSEEALKSVLDIFESRKETGGNFSYTRTLHNYGDSLATRGKTAESLPYFEKAIALKGEMKALDQKYLTSYLQSILTTAHVRESIGQYDEAEKLYKRRISEARLSTSDENSALTANNPKVALGRFALANFYHYVKSNKKAAKSNLNEAIEVFENMESPELENLANCYALAGTIELDGGDIKVAEQNFQRAHDIFQKMRTKASPQWPETLKGLAECKLASRDLKAAEPLYRRALAVGLRFGHQYAPTVDLCLKRIDQIDQQNGRPYSESLKRGEMRLKIDSTKHAMDSITIMRDYLYLHDLARQHNDMKLAQEYLNQATMVCEKTIGEDGWNWAQILFKRGQLSFDRGKKGDGEVAFEKLVDLIEKLKVDKPEHKQLLEELSFQLESRMSDDKDLADRVAKLK